MTWQPNIFLTWETSSEPPPVTTLSPLVSLSGPSGLSDSFTPQSNNHHMALQLTTSTASTAPFKCIVNNFPPLPRILLPDLHNLTVHVMDMFSAAAPELPVPTVSKLPATLLCTF